MTLLKCTSIWVGLLAALTLAQTSKADAGIILITAEEAKLPGPTQMTANRAITRGPRIDVSHFDNGQVHSPLRFKLTFRAFGGATIDVDSLAVTYLRASNIDLTERVRPFVQRTGIDIPEAEVPPGQHAIRVELRDSDGRPAAVNLMLSVAPN
ncbi:MAG: hypothetical protein ACJ8EF_04545 [Bradyrhizobium sp.]